MNMKKFDLKNAKRPLIGSWITLAHPAIAEIMAKNGFDWLAVDLEHSVITIGEAEQLIRIIQLCGVVPLVRLTSNNADLIKRVMDAGAQGIIVPMVNSADQAQQAVDAVHYPPEGNRGVGLARAQGYGENFNDYLQWQKNNSTVIVQIEHKDSLENLERIFSVKGVSGFIIGPYDLSASMGIPGEFEHPDFLKALEKIAVVAKTKQLPGGIHIIEPEPVQLKTRIKEGYKFIAYSLDIRMLNVACKNGLEVIKH